MVKLKKMLEEMNVDLRNALTGYFEILIHQFQTLLSFLVPEATLTELRERSQQDDIDIQWNVQGCDEGEHPLIDQHVAEHGNQCDLELVLYLRDTLGMSGVSKVTVCRKLWVEWRKYRLLLEELTLWYVFHSG